MMEMPPLPEPHHKFHHFSANPPYRTDLFRSDQMREYGESCARMAREEERERIESSEVVQFLYGADRLDGVVFSEVPPGKPRYWWRSILRATIKG